MRSNKIRFVLIMSFLLILILFGCTSAYKAEFTQEEYTVYVGESITPSVKIKPKKSEYTLFSSNNTLAQIKGDTVVGVKTGVVTLTLSAGDMVDTAKVYILDKNNIEVNDVTFEDTGIVVYCIANFGDLGLEKAEYRTTTHLVGTDITKSFPTVLGYSLSWYTDDTCTTPVPTAVLSQTGTTYYYALAKELNNTVLLNEEGMITGLLYPNLPHAYLTFPERYNEQEIHGIADKAFYGDTTITHVRIPASYTYIGKFAFAGCINLTEVVIDDVENSVLTEIGAYAFAPTYSDGTEEETSEEYSEYTDLGDTDVLGILSQLLGLTEIGGSTEEEETEPELTLNTDYCEKLTTFVLPDSLSVIGAYAFYQCKNLDVEKIPSSLKIIDYGVFMETKIKSVNLSNVEQIYAYAFYGCKELSAVSNAMGVISCGGYAFNGTPLYTSQAKEGVVYASTMLVGCNERLGTMIGNGKLNIRSATTLIADYALNVESVQELTLTFPSSQNVKIGWEAFYVTGYEDENRQFPIYSDTLFLAVPEGELSTYRQNNPRYSPYFCTKKIVEITDQNAVNYGTHTLLKITPEKGSAYYVYDFFTVNKTEEGKNLSPIEINLNLLPVTGIKRINTCAFNNIGRLQKLTLSTVTELGSFAIAKCNNLAIIDISQSEKLAFFDNSSIQFSSLSHTGFSDSGYLCYLQVTLEKYEYMKLYFTENKRNSAVKQLRFCEHLTLKVEEKEIDVEFLTDGTGIPYDKEGYTVTWYLDEEHTTPWTTFTTQSMTLYGILSPER